ncbi:trypsin-like peptidase domain-containing protein [Psychrobacter sp. I-STPA6b]|uniref:trypsin-like peptidase domain-containing protein n=1 Tax=Psychrobacter sp. I-STPA6b TaxID=2585718 RepID=UPI001D0C722B|nr:trypsin-like peptidase domain-containing protein [Psychrobacter sp. I-STPA6b]
MTTTLVLGANTVISQAKCTVNFKAINPNQAFNQQLGMLWLPLDDKRHAICSPAYLHETKDWASLDNTNNPKQWRLDLDSLFDKQGVHFLQLIAYTYHSPTLNLPAVELDGVQLSIDNEQIHYEFTTQERHVKAVIVLEIYRRNGQYKCRALGETSTQGLDSLSQRVQIAIDTRPPQTHEQIQAQNQQISSESRQRPPRQVQAGETWTGTAFAIDPYHLLTCHHVIESAQMIGIRQQGQPDREVQVVLSDIGSDSAIIKVSEPLPCYLPLATGCTDFLGETITTLGFPLSGLSSQLQVTQGCISALTGFGDDIRYMQFTAPIQPGSSGSPLLLPTGEVIAMATSSFAHEHAQNVNYAVKFQLLSALLTSAGISLTNPHLNQTHNNAQIAVSPTPLTTPQLSRQSRGALWLVGCQA